MESNATVMVVNPDEAALRTGQLDAASYIAVMKELKERLSGVALVLSTVSLDTPDERINEFNRQVREHVLQSQGVLLDTSDIESWHRGVQALQDGVPVRHAAYRVESNLPSEENLGRQGAALWWLLARLSGWEESPAPQGE